MLETLSVESLSFIIAIFEVIYLGIIYTLIFLVSKSVREISVKGLLPVSITIIIIILSFIFIFNPVYTELQTTLDNAIEREVTSEMETTIEESVADTENPVVEYLIHRDCQNKITDCTNSYHRSLVMLAILFTVVYFLGSLAYLEFKEGI